MPASGMCIFGIVYIHIAVDMAPRHEIHPAVEEMCILGIVYSC